MFSFYLNYTACKKKISQNKCNSKREKLVLHNISTSQKIFPLAIYAFLAGLKVKKGLFPIFAFNIAKKSSEDTNFRNSLNYNIFNSFYKNQWTKYFFFHPFLSCSVRYMTLPCSRQSYVQHFVWNTFLLGVFNNWKKKKTFEKQILANYWDK